MILHKNTIIILITGMLLCNCAGICSAEKVGDAKERGPSTISKIGFVSGEEYDKIYVQMDSPVQPKFFALVEPDRIVMDFYASKLDINKAILYPDNSRIKEVRYAQFSKKPPITRIVLEVKDALDHKIDVAGNAVIIFVGKDDDIKDTAAIAQKKEFKNLEDKDLAADKGTKITTAEIQSLMPNYGISFPDMKKTPKIKILVNDQELALPDKPVFVRGIYMVKASDLLRKLNFDVSYDKKTEVLSGKRADGLEMSIKLDSKQLAMDGEERVLNEPLSLVDDQLYLPLKGILLNFGYGSYYDWKNKKLYIAPRVTDIRYETVQGVPRIVVEATDIITPDKPQIMKNTNEIVFDIPNSIFAYTPETLAITDDSIMSARGYQLDPKTTRIVIKMKQMAPYALSKQKALKQVIFSFPAAIGNISATENKKGVEIEIESSKPIEVKARALHNPERIVIDIPGALYQSHIMTDVGKGAVESIRGSQFLLNPLTSRIVIDLNQKVPYKVALSKDQQKVIIQIDEPSHKVEPVAKDLQDVLKGKVIILDPGHGGADPGAFGVSGTVEKELTLDTALRLSKLLTNAGASVLMTREEDTDTNLKEIAEFANSNFADLFISLHYNAFERAKTNGTETYYYNDNSKDLAQRIHKKMNKMVARADRGCMKVKYYVLNHTTMPAALIEPAYLTNPDDENLIKSKEFRQKVAEATFSGIKEYLESR
ncbi:MAG: N-acetylmuramoyl-L-alanine amidase [bacterium]